VRPVLTANLPGEWLTRHEQGRISRRTTLAGIGCWLLAVSAEAAAEPQPRLRFGVLGYGTAAWEVAVTRQHGRCASIDTPYAVSNAAEVGKTALLAGSVDVIVSDWLWAMRQRAKAPIWSFTPILVPSAHWNCHKARPFELWRTSRAKAGDRGWSAGQELDSVASARPPSAEARSCLWKNKGRRTLWRPPKAGKCLKFCSRTWSCRRCRAESWWTGSRGCTRRQRCSTPPATLGR